MITTEQAPTESTDTEEDNHADSCPGWYHIYPGYNYNAPPFGAVALCGHKRHSTSGPILMTGTDPRECTVCILLQETI